MTTLKIERKCKCCDGTGIEKKEVEIKAGMTLIPVDGSSMPNALHSLLFKGVNKEGFYSVKVLGVEGRMIAVIPSTWVNRDVRHKEKYNPEIYSALSAIFIGGTGVEHILSFDGDNIAEGFWMFAGHCRLL
jgi:hypothetical protein